MFTVRCVLMVLGGSVALGVPVAWLLKGCRPLEERDWLLAPFLGIAAAVLALHNFVYFDYTVARVAPWVWGAAGVGWLAVLLSAARGEAGRRSLASCPWLVYLAAAAVFCVHGLGLFAVGAHTYLARGVSDQYNYTSMAQFLVDVPYSTGWDALGHRAYLVDGAKIRGDRMGVMLLQGFFAVSLRADARALFEPTILLGPGFAVLAVYALGRRLGLGKWYALATAAAAGAVPGIATLHLMAFLAQVVALPFVLMNLYTLHELGTAPRWGRLLGTALLLAATIALYTEMLPVLLGLTALCLVGGVVFRTVRLLPALALLVEVPALSLGLNPLFCNSILAIRGRITMPTPNWGPIFFAYRPRGLACLWVNDTWAFRPGWPHVLMMGFSLAVTALAGLGLVGLGGRCLRLVWSRSDRADRDCRGRCLLGLAVAAVAALPLVVLLRDRQHPYQFLKLTVSFSPLLVVGIAHAWDGLLGLAGLLAPAARAARPTLRWGTLGTLLAVTLTGTGALALETATSRSAPLSAQHVLLDKDYCSLVRLLRTLKDSNVVLACGPGVYLNSWLSFAARHNDVWLVNPVLNDGIAIGCTKPPTPNYRYMPVAPQLIDLRTVPAEALLVTVARGPAQVRVEGDRHLVWANPSYQVWRLGPGPFALLPTEAALRPQ
jgi:hypothetical protein